MTTLADLIAAGGGSKLGFGLRIEGLEWCPVSDPSLASWSPGDNDEQEGFDGLDPAGEYAIEERIDWLTATLDAGNLTVTVLDRDQPVGSTALARQASRIFGGRVPTLRTWLAAPLSDTDTSVTVSSTAGWPETGYLHIGRERIAYNEITDGVTFGDCTRGAGGTLAVTHNYEDERPESIEVTDTPVSLKGRRAQLYMAIDETGDLGDDNIIWRGIVTHIEQIESGLGWTIEMDHVSTLLDKQIGATLGPFHLDGYYFPDEEPFRLQVNEFATDSPASDPTVDAQCVVSIVGRVATRDELVAAINAQLQPTSGTSSWSATPTNRGYSATIGNGGQLVVQFATGAGEAGDPRWVNVYCLFPGVASEPTSYLVDEDGNPANVFTGVAGALTYTVIPFPGRSTWTRDEFPDAYTLVRPRSLTTIPEDGDAATHPPNRIYHDGSGDPSGVTEIATPPSYGSGAAAARLRIADTETNYLVVEPRMGERGTALRWYGWADAPVEFQPVLAFEKQRFDQWLHALAVLTPTSGTSGLTPYLPESEFDWDDIERVVLAQSGDSFAKEWRIHKAGSLREQVTPELLAMGLCWATTSTGLVTVVAIGVASGAAGETIEISEDTNGPALTPTLSMQPDGVINIVEVRGGWNPETEEYDSIIGAAEMPASFEHFDKQRFVIEPKGTELKTSFTDADFRARVAKSLCHIYAFEYAICALVRCPGLFLADALLGAIVSITDTRVVWRGEIGVTNAKGQVVGRRIAWNGSHVDLWVMLTEWNATAYSPSAKLSATTPMGGTDNKRLTMRAEQVYSGNGYDYRDFQAGDKIRVRRWDYATSLVVESFTIDSIDETNHYIYVTSTPATDFNASGSRWIMEFDDYDTCAAGDNATRQLKYAFIARGDMVIDSAEVPAQVWAA